MRLLPVPHFNMQYHIRDDTFRSSDIRERVQYPWYCMNRCGMSYGAVLISRICPSHWTACYVGGDSCTSTEGGCA